MLHQYVKQKILLIKGSTEQYIFYHYCLKYTKNQYLNNYLSMLTNSWVKYYVVLEKLIVHNKPYLDYCSHAKKN